MAFEPFIVTAGLPPDIFAWADGLRRAHYPPERNHLHAHVTLFHAFAPSLRDELGSLLPSIAAEFAPVPARITGPMDLGRGTALAIGSPGMLEIRAMIADHFHGALTDQDRHPPRLHITIQNKVTRAQALALQQALTAGFRPRAFSFSALELHLYRGGPWEELGRFSFRGRAVA